MSRAIYSAPLHADFATDDDLIHARDWETLASRCKHGTVIAGYRIGKEEAMLLAAYLPDHLRGDWADDDFHISKEGFAQ